MKYQDALADCLTRIAHGEERESAIARHGDYAAELQGDVALAAGLGHLGEMVSAPTGAQDRAWLALQTELRTQRRVRSSGGRATTVFGRAPGRSSLARGALAAAALAAVAIIALGITTASGGPDVARPLASLLGSSTAEAAAFDGVVVENASGVLTVQTASGLETVSVPAGTAIADAQGAAVGLPDLAAGQAVTIKGKRLNNGTVAASKIDGKTIAALQDWCTGHGDECQKLKDGLEKLVSQCRAQNQPACQALESRLTEVRERLGAINGQLEDLGSRCQRGGALACRELKRFCDQHRKLCQGANQRAPAPK